MSYKNIKLQTRIIVLVIIVLLSSLSITGFLINHETTKNIKNTQEEKVMDIALSVRNSKDVIEGLKNDEKSKEIQAYTLNVQKLTNVNYIVVLDTDHKRKSHPIKSRIGEYFVGGDEYEAFNGKRYTSTAMGTLGESIRAFVPVWDGNRQIGVVSVGLLTDTVETQILKGRDIIYIGIIIGGIIGIIGAILLAKNIKKTLYGLEPIEISQLFRERDAMLSSVREGIIAINNSNEIIIANDSAQKIFLQAGIPFESFNSTINNLSNTQLYQALLCEKEIYDEEIRIKNVNIIVNVIPIYIENKITGKVATFRLKNELTFLMEQLSIVKTYAEMLREQTHEFMNKTHVIMAMVQTKSYEELNAYIEHISSNYKEETSSVPFLVKDPTLAGYLINKIHELKKRNIIINLTGKHPLPTIKKIDKVELLVTIFGNLLDNSADALMQNKKKLISIDLNYENNFLNLVIQDNGFGIEAKELSMIFKKGKSSKGKDRGYGLYIIKQQIEEANGTIDVSSIKGKGSKFTVKLPYFLED